MTKINTAKSGNVLIDCEECGKTVSYRLDAASSKDTVAAIQNHYITYHGRYSEV